MTLTAFLAVWGAVVGTAALVLSVRKEILDRPNLYISTSYTADPGKLPDLIVHVTNNGRQAVGIREVGLMDREGKERILVRDPWVHSVLGPHGETLDCRWTVQEKPPFDPELEVRAFARTTGMKVAHEEKWFRHLRDAKEMARAAAAGERPDFV